MPYALSQQYGWVDLYPNMPDTPNDTVYIGGDPYYGTYAGLFFINENEGWVTSIQPDEEEQNFLIFHTTDGGQSWEIQKHWNYSQAIWMLDSLNGYLVDHSGFIMVTHDGGDTWAFHGAVGAPVNDISFAPGSDTGYVSVDETYYFWQITPQGVNQIDMGHLNYWTGISANDEVVWICGGIQVFFWDLASQALLPELVVHSGYFSDIFFIDRDHGWIGNQGQIRGFVEYDYFWPVIFNTGELTVTCLHALDTNNLWATVWDGRIMHTTNASDYGYIKETNYYWSNVVWEEQPHPKSDNLLSSIQFLSMNCGYACGENNTILKYTELTGMEEQGSGEAGKRGGVEVWPNPTRGKFQITSTRHQTNSKFQISNFIIEVVDLYGKPVAISPLHRMGDGPGVGAGTLELDLSGYPAGIYFVRVDYGNELIVKKIVKL